MPASKFLDENGLRYLWDKIKDHVSDAIANGTSDIANSIHFVVPNEKSSTATLTATVDDIEALTPGLVIALRMPFNNMANTTLNINDLGAKRIYYKSTTTSAGMFPGGSVILFVYEETTTASGCFKAVYSYDVSYTTRMYAAGSSNATANAYSETDPDSTYLVLADTSTSTVSNGGVKVLGTGSTSVTAAGGVLKINTPLENEAVPNEAIDTLFDGGYFYIDKTFTFTNGWYGNGLIYFETYIAEDGSETGLDYKDWWYAYETEEMTENFVIQSNQDYVLHNPLCTVEELIESNARGMWIGIRGNDEDGNTINYSTVGSSVAGCEASPHETFSGVLVNTADRELDDPSESTYWYVVAFDPSDLDTEEGIVFYLNYECESLRDYEGGHFIDQDSVKFKVTLFKDQSGENVMAKIRYICVM